jgi:hypothetical protein
MRDDARPGTVAGELDRRQRSRVKVVEQMLGHGTATLTLDLCGHLSRTGSTTSPTGWTPP